MITINDYMTVFNAVTIDDDVESVPINVSKITNYAVQAEWTGTPVGDLKLQASCDQSDSDVGTGVVTWEDIADATVATGGAAGSVFFNYTVPPGYNWMRVVYISGSSTGTLTAKYNGKG